MSDRAAVLFANDAFYVAFMKHDIKAMEDLWASEAIISCIHPGWGHLLGRDHVIESWANILADHDGSSFTVEGAEVRVFSDMAVVICYEVFKVVTLVATNIFLREGGIWRMMHHQSSPSPPPLVTSENIKRKTIQ